jgi:hypothetical protein
MPRQDERLETFGGEDIAGMDGTGVPEGIPSSVMVDDRGVERLAVVSAPHF